MIENKLPEKYGFKVELMPQTTSTEGVNNLISGSTDISYTQGSDVALEAIAKDVNQIKFLNLLDDAIDRPWSSIIVTQNSDINRPKDLEGKKLLVQTGPTSEKVARKYLSSNGVDVSKIEFVPLSYDKHLDVLGSGQASAAYTFEPNITNGAKKFNTRILIPGMPTQIGLKHVSGSLISNKFLTQKPELAKKFQQAIDESIDFVSQNEVQARTFLPKYLGIDEELAKEVIVSKYLKSTEMSPEILQEYVEKSNEVGNLSTATKNINFKEALYK
jgi:NitT/TauT family transport system substrate-binding protein